MEKNQANAKQHPEAELLQFENYSHFSSTLSSKSNRTYSKKWAKEQVCLYSWDYTINYTENEDENEKRSHKFDINRRKPRYSKYKVFQYDVAYMY